jgi:hypothetical protein
MFIATCILTSAVVRRLLPNGTPNQWIYVGVDGLILLGVAGDWVVGKRIHRAYLYGVPPLLLGQLIVFKPILGLASDSLSAHRIALAFAEAQLLWLLASRVARRGA